MKYINRTLENYIIKLSKEYSCILLTGPRQVGKSTILTHISDNDKREYITLDDLNERKMAKNDPGMFFKIHSGKLLIDEIQYAPELFSYIKIAIDKGAEPGTFFLTGSQSFKLMSIAQESLAGRIAILNLSSLSQSEISGYNNSEFIIDIDALKNREFNKLDLDDIYLRIFNGGMPALASGKYSDRELYYNSYISTFVERDVSDEIRLVDKFLFSDFIRACACRTSQILNIHSIASDVSVSDDTAKRWLHVLEKSNIIYFLHPLSNNLLKRTIKSPKMYFFDTGLISVLTKHSSAKVLQNDSINGAILENYVINEILKSYLYVGKEPLAYYYRDVDGNEIDLCLMYDNKIHPIEIKKTSSPNENMIKSYKVLENSNFNMGNGCILCFADKLSVLDKNNYIIPIYYI